MEAAVSSTNKDIAKLEEEILSLLTSLKANDRIEEAAELISVGRRRRCEDVDESRMDVEETSTTQLMRGKLRRKTQPMSRSQAKVKASEMDSAALPMMMDEDGGGGQQQPHRRRPVVGGGDQTEESYTLIQSSVFLLPVLETWVLGMTLTNSSKKAQKLPDLLLNLAPRESTLVDKPCRVFSYSVQVTPLDVKYAAMERRNVHGGIPYQDTFRLKKEIRKECLVHPGCQILLTATFRHPLGFCGRLNSFDILVSVCLNNEQLWSGTVPAALDDEAFCTFNVELYETHQVSIFSAFGKHQECFKMKRLEPHGNKSPHKAIENFLLPLGFENIMSEKVGVDTSIEVFASNEFTMMWGVTFKIEKCFRSINTLRCLVSARSEHQMQIFTKLFSAWIKRQRDTDEEGCKGLLVVRMKSGDEDEVNMANTLSSEISTLSLLGQLGQKRKLKSGSSKPDCQWIHQFIESLSATDAIFMHHMSGV